MARNFPPSRESRSAWAWGLLLCSQIDERTRRGAGFALIAVGLLATIPIALRIFGDSD